MTTQTQQVTVPVPEDRIPEFYEMFGRWLASDPSPMDGTELTVELSDFADASPELVAEWWLLLTEPAKRVFKLLANRPDRRFDGAEIAEHCEIENGASGVAGTLSWPGKYAKNRFGLAFPLGWDPKSEKYYMSPAVARLIDQVN